jgi:hypothetical protein
MKRAGFFLFLLLALAPALASAQSLANLLLEVETATPWVALEDGWRERRTGWLEEVKAARGNAAQLAALMREYEQNIKFAAQQESWHADRGEWVEQASGCKKAACLRKLLLELEGSLLGSAMDADWGRRRSAWAAEVKRGS